MLRPALIALVSLALACQCPPEVKRYSADTCHGGRPGQPVVLGWSLKQQVHKHTLPGGTLRFEVLRSVATPMSRSLLLVIRVRNRHDHEVRFRLDDITLIHDGTRVSRPKPLDGDRSPSVEADGEKVFQWEFALGAKPVAGPQQLEIGDIAQWVGGERDADLASPFRFTVYIGGRTDRAASDDEGAADEPQDESPASGAEPDGDWDTERPPR